MNEFIFGSVYDGMIFSTYFNKNLFADKFQSFRYQSSYIIATNLSFDFFGTFFGFENEKEFSLLFRGSSLICATSSLHNGKFIRHGGKNKDKVIFIDTMNYAPLSVEKWGKLLGELKLKESVNDLIGKKPKNTNEWYRMIRYNHQDTKISHDAARFLLDSFLSFGASPKMTIGSTAMSLFRNKYLDRKYYCLPEEITSFHFKGVYGGNTHAYSRGIIDDHNFMDINSLYPFAMLNEFPDINEWRRSYSDSSKNIIKYHGMSDITVNCPYMQYPFLAVHVNGKMIMPIGKFRGWYTHIEIRKAISLGYSIEKVHQCHYFPLSCQPFNEYVNDLYKKRLEYQEKGSQMEFIVKLLLNSLFGKFSQKYEERENMTYDNLTPESLSKLNFVERVGNFIRTRETSKPSVFCIPLWAAYITGYARMILHDLIIRYKPLYVDTDSLVIKGSMPESLRLGKCKKIMNIKDGFIVRPKFYMFSPKERDKKPYVRIKGIGMRLNEEDFKNILINKKAEYRRFMRIRESVRKGISPNRIVPILKNLDLEDIKRKWPKKFDPTELQNSEPLVMDIVNGENIIR